MMDPSWQVTHALNGTSPCPCTGTFPADCDSGVCTGARSYCTHHACCSNLWLHQDGSINHACCSKLWLHQEGSIHHACCSNPWLHEVGCTHNASWCCNPCVHEVGCTHHARCCSNPWLHQMGCTWKRDRAMPSCCDAVEYEWTPKAAGAESKSGVWVTKKGPAGTRSGYTPWTRIVSDQSGNESQAEFGTSIKVCVPRVQDWPFPALTHLPAGSFDRK
jgi:hypothetical protein